MPNDDTSYYADLNPDNEEENRVRGLLREAGLIEPNPTPPKPSDFPFEFPATFEVAESEQDYYLRLVGSDQEHTIDKHPVLDPGDEVTFFEHGGKARLSVSKKPNGGEEYDPKYGKREIEPGLYEVTGTKGPGDEVSSLLKTAQRLAAPLPDADKEFDSEEYIEFPDEEVFEDGSPNHADLNYQDYLWDILSEGHESGDRTGTGTYKVTGRQMAFDLTEGFPLLTCKRTWFKGAAAEALWMLRGQTNIKPLVDRGISFWTPNAYEVYKESVENPHDEKTFEAFIRSGESISDNKFAQQWGGLGPIYGAQWRGYGEDGFDQIANLIEQLQENPDSRRLRVTAWRPEKHMKGGPGTDEVALPPCHVSFQVTTRELSYKERYKLWQDYRSDEDITFALSKPPADTSEWTTKEARHDLFDEEEIPRRALTLTFQMRSSDGFLGLPNDIARYALIAHLLGHMTNMMPERLVFQGVDCHIYKNHLEQTEEAISRTPRAELPQLKIGREEPPDDIGDYQFEDFSIEGYDPRPNIEAPLAV